MSSLFRKPKVSKPKPVKINTETEQDRAEKQRQLDDEESRRKRASLGSNLLFSDSEESGAQAAGPSILQKKLLGD